MENWQKPSYVLPKKSPKSTEAMELAQNRSHAWTVHAENLSNNTLFDSTNEFKFFFDIFTFQLSAPF